ncbi:hypothetical protein ACFE04_022362 [Oxalis oulophora]
MSPRLDEMGSQAEQEYADFQAKVCRTVYLDNLSPKVTEQVLRTAMDQFGTVKTVEFIPNYLGPVNMPQCALVEMENQKQSEAVIKSLAENPFMIAGMPRPVRAAEADETMFDDPPPRPGRSIQCRWLDANDPDFETAKEIKRAVKRHSEEVAYLVKQQLESEEKLANHQAQLLKANNTKFDMIDKVTSDQTAQSLAQCYSLKIADD